MNEQQQLTTNNSVVLFCRKLAQSRWFPNSIIGLIIINAIVIGLETSAELTRMFGGVFEIINVVILGVFVIEMLVKMIALAPSPHHYFKSNWNCFDFIIIVLSLIPMGGSMATLARLIRLLRVLRLFSALPELRLLIDTLLRSIPSMGQIAMLMSIVFYIYGVAGFYLFSEIDPTHWRSLGISLLSLFRIVTLEDWTDIMYAAMEQAPWAWMYFVSFVIAGTFVIINLFVAIVLNNLEQAKLAQLEELRIPPNREEILMELQRTQEALNRLQRRLSEVDVKSHRN